VPPGGPTARAPGLRSQPVRAPLKAAPKVPAKVPATGQLVVPDDVVRAFFARAISSRDAVRAGGWTLEALGLLVNQRIDALLAESRKRAEEADRRVAATEASLAKERATVDRWVAWHEAQEQERRDEARNPPRSHLGGNRYRSRNYERDEYDDEGCGYDYEYGQKRPRRDEY